MARLGEILIERKLITQSDLRAGLEACRRHGGRLGTWLVRLGILKEVHLLDALVEQTGCPPAAAFDLASVPDELRRLVPLSFAQRNMVMPFARHGRNLDVAMANPSDLLLVDEVAALTGLQPRAFVATEAAIAAALALAPPPEVGEAPPPGPPRSSTREWRRFWTMDASPGEILGALETTHDGWTAQVSVATFPGLAPITEHATDENLVATIDLEELSAILATASHRNQVAEGLLQFLLALAARVALFSLHQNRVMGWAAGGLGVVKEDFESLILPLDRPSVFLNLGRSELHLGPLGGGEGNALLLEALGGPAPEDALIVPLQVRDKPVGFLWLDCGSESVSSVPVGLVREAARLANLALEAIVLRQKIRSPKRLTGGGVSD